MVEIKLFWSRSRRYIWGRLWTTLLASAVFIVILARGTSLWKTNRVF